MDGPRFSKLKSAFEKMLDQIFQETDSLPISAKEEIQSQFTQILLKYSLPSKLNELDARLERPTPFYDVTNESEIEKILTSYLHLPISQFLNAISTEELKIKREISKCQEAETEQDKEIADLTTQIIAWADRVKTSIHAIRRHAQ
ncbi:hypothetical protein NEHOM01_1482 [Nematocida homosporus]|uniref:uncharacterized protein n=1 Tax=Nematocida homosporus TaxID=1912981 RepID=UPI00221F1D21|nr:uncharacterized protein NEHOM01_1482 [Nematocida homosporus]KAI5186449.1 hypothetical protein NEHOM01_1482 [Nematocida homosporus]